MSKCTQMSHLTDLDPIGFSWHKRSDCTTINLAFLDKGALNFILLTHEPQILLGVWFMKDHGKLTV